jgi:hypothetical protein
LEGGVACVGTIDGRSGGQVAGEPSDDGGGGAAGEGGGSLQTGEGGNSPAAPGLPGPRPVRRLSRIELTNTLADLLGVPAEVPAELPDLMADSGYVEGGGISKVEAESLIEWTGRLATAGAPKVTGLSGCAAPPATRTEQDRCARVFIEKFGRRAFRRPLSQSSRTTCLRTTATSCEERWPTPRRRNFHGLVWLILQSPRFLNHWQRPAEPAPSVEGKIALDGHEIASRLSYLLPVTRDMWSIRLASRIPPASGVAITPPSSTARESAPLRRRGGCLSGEE